MIEALVVAGAILASAALLIWFGRPKPDARKLARTLVRAIEKRSEWDATIETEHVKRARVKLALMSMTNLSGDWVDMLIEEAVFDMEAARGLGHIDRDTSELRVVGEENTVGMADVVR